MNLRKLLNGKTVAELLAEGEPGSFITARKFLIVLGEGLWHTTSPERYSGILKAKAVLPEPGLPDSERWKTAAGPKHYPYVRSLGGVSLFDFKGFEPESYRAAYPMSTWEEFVPYRSSRGAAVWLEIDRNAASESLIAPKALVEKWNREGAHGHTLMPMIEAAHLGPIPIERVCRVIRVDSLKKRIEELPIPLLQ